MTQPRLLGGRYELDGVVGRGGMAEVYRARDIRLDRIVAIKTLRTDLARDQIFQARFRREAQSAASLNHPSIVAVYDTGEDMATGVPVPYIVMEYVDGRTVRDLLQDGHRLLPERSLEIIDGVLRALDYSHQAGIVHRDIKPGNVMVTRNGDVKVMDFGIARAMSDAQATMTQTAQVIGTAQYLSPEQARGERVDSRSDLYSTGCLLYELLTGRPPFTGDSPVAIAYQHVRENPIPPSRVDPDVPPWADAIVLKAMAKSPADRYQTAGRHACRPAARRLRPAGGGRAADPGGHATRDAADRPGHDDGGPDGSRSRRFATTTTPDGGYARRRAPRGGGGHRWIPWVLGLVLVLGVVVGVAYYLLAGGKTYSVPLVNGETVATAQQARSPPSTCAPPWSTRPARASRRAWSIKSTPAEGNIVPANTLVTLYVSTGAAPVAVPNVVGQQQSAAESTLTERRLQGPDQGGRDLHRSPRATVMSQSPSGGTAAPGFDGDDHRLRRGRAVPRWSAIPRPAPPDPDHGRVQGQRPAGLRQAQYARHRIEPDPGHGADAAKGSTVTIYVQNAASPSVQPLGDSDPGPSPSGAISRASDRSSGPLCPGGRVANVAACRSPGRLRAWSGSGWRAWSGSEWRACPVRACRSRSSTGRWTDAQGKTTNHRAAARARMITVIVPARAAVPPGSRCHSQPYMTLLLTLRVLGGLSAAWPRPGRR